MPNPQEQIDKIESLNEELSKENDRYAEFSKKKKDAKERLDIKVCEIITQQLEKNTPPSLITKLVNGDKEVVLIRREWENLKEDCATSKIKMKNITTEIESNRSILSWLKAEFQST